MNVAQLRQREEESTITQHILSQQNEITENYHQEEGEY